MTRASNISYLLSNIPSLMCSTHIVSAGTEMYIFEDCKLGALHILTALDFKSQLLTAT